MPSTASQLRSLPCSGSSQPSYACAPAGSPKSETVSFFHRPTASSDSFSGFINESLGEIPVEPIKPQLAYQCGQQYSITALTDSGGSIVERYAYSAYGVPTITNAAGVLRSVSSYDNRYTYTGREWDDTLLMYHYRARMYDAELGMFMGRDPLGYIDGVFLYTYVRSNPGISLDPLGLFGRNDVTDDYLDGLDPDDNPRRRPRHGPSGHRPGYKPSHGVPDGTLPIDQHIETVGNEHCIKGNLEDFGVGPASWVGITPDGDIVLTNPDGSAEIVSGPWQDYMSGVCEFDLLCPTGPDFEIPLDFDIPVTPLPVPADEDGLPGPSTNGPIFPRFPLPPRTLDDWLNDILDHLPSFPSREPYPGYPVFPGGNPSWPGIPGGLPGRVPVRIPIFIPL